PHVLHSFPTRRSSDLACMPRPSVFASSNEDRTDDDINSKIYPMAEACKVTKPYLLPTHRRNKRHIHLKYSRIRRAFSGSPSTLADRKSTRLNSSHVKI